MSQCSKRRVQKLTSTQKQVPKPMPKPLPKPAIRQTVKKKSAIELILPKLREEEKRTQERNLIRQKEALEKVLHQINQALISH